MAGDPFFTIITPCFNSEKTIETTIQSVIHQTYRNFEYILIDGGSNDHTLSIIEQYEKQYPKMIRHVSERDQGIYDAINKGIQAGISGGKSQLIGIVNSDDFYEPTALEDMADAYKENTGKCGEYAIYYGMIRIMDGGTERSIAFNNHKYLPERMITHPACFVATKLYQDKGLYSLDYRSASDYDFMLRMFEDKEVVFQPVYKIISNFSTGGISDTKLGDHESKLIRYRYGYMTKKALCLHWLSYYGRFWRK